MLCAIRLKYLNLGRADKLSSTKNRYAWCIVTQHRSPQGESMNWVGQRLATAIPVFPVIFVVI